MSGKKKRRIIIIAVVVLIVIIGIPLVAVGSSFFGRIAPDSVIPDSFDLYATVPNPARLAERVLGHESLPDIMALAELSSLMPVINQLKDTGLAENKLIRFAARGRLDGAFLAGGEPLPSGAREAEVPGGQILAAWDAGIASPLLKILPLLAGRLTVPRLYYVQAGKNSRFEYRLENGTVFFIGPYRNLLIISNNSKLFESVISGNSPRGSGAGNFRSSDDYDIAFLLSPAALMKVLGGGAAASAETETAADAEVISALNLLRFHGPVEARLSVLPNQLKLSLAGSLGANNQALQKIIERNSPAPTLSAMIPESAQYLTLLSAGSLEELLAAASAIAAGTPAGADWENAVRRAESSARAALNMNLEELLFSWTGSQFAVFGLEGRPNPVVAVEIKDERKRKEVFDKAFKSIFLSENIQLNLDGNRIPRVQLPPFLNSFLQLLGVNVPSPYYSVQNNCLFISESAETLLAAVNAARRNEVLPKTDLWRALSEDNSGPSSFNLFYSLDRSLPFFLKGRSAATAVLKTYRQGLAGLHLKDSLLTVSLSVIPGAGKGLVPIAGYPLDIAGAAGDSAEGRTGNRVYSVFSGKDTTLLLTRGGSALAVNPASRVIKELKMNGTPGGALYSIPAAAGNAPGNSGEAAWVVNSQGHVILADKDMAPLQSFPLSTGIQLSSPPGAWGGKLFLSGEDGSVYTVDNRASVSRWGTEFSSALRSPPSFLDYKNKSYAASYPKSFIFGEIVLSDAGGAVLPGWPVPVSGIAFGSPLLFASPPAVKPEGLLAAFITQAGELAVYTESGETLPGFPRGLDGVFYLQPVFDGESLWIIESEGTLYRVEMNGEVFSQKIPRLSVREDGYITAADIDGDKKGEIFFSGAGNALYGYSRDFNSLDGFPLPVWGRPVIADLNGDRKIEAAGVGMDNRLYQWQFR